MSKNIVETLIGALVIFIAAAFLYFAYIATDLTNGSETDTLITARFDRADGLSLGSEVKIGGVKVGKVAEFSLDPKTFQAIVKMRVKDGVTVPVDSTAEIIGNGFLGEKYIAIIPGSETDHISNNGAIEYTQSSVSLESMIGKFIFGNTQKTKEASNTNSHS